MRLPHALGLIWEAQELFEVFHKNQERSNASRHDICDYKNKFKIGMSLKWCEALGEFFSV